MGRVNTIKSYLNTIDENGKEKLIKKERKSIFEKISQNIKRRVKQLKDEEKSARMKRITLK